MAQQLTTKSRPLGKDEVSFLLNQITSNPIITSKATNATNNKLKEDAWKTISTEFSAMLGEVRRPEQLRLKWENLKKAARKRSALIRHNNLKTGGGKAYIPPDEILDRVASLLGATCTGFSVEFGGDGDMVMPNRVEVVHTDVVDVELIEEVPVEQAEGFGLVSRDIGLECGGGVSGGSNGGGGENEANYKPKKLLSNTPKCACKLFTIVLIICLVVARSSTHNSGSLGLESGSSQMNVTHTSHILCYN